MHEFNQVNLYWIRVERPEIAARVGQAIDQTFRDTDSETKTEAEGTFLLSFISMLGNVRGIILMVGLAVTFAVLSIVANSVAMSIRERVTEAALMRSLGFTSRQVLALFVGESLAVTVGGAAMGVGGATLALRRHGPAAGRLHGFCGHANAAGDYSPLHGPVRRPGHFVRWLAGLSSSQRQYL